MITDELRDLGIKLKSSRVGKHRAKCPWCDRKGYDDALAVKLDDCGGAVWWCHRCQVNGNIAGDRSTFGIKLPRGNSVRSPPAAKQEKHETLAPYWRDFWATCRPIWSDTPAAHYLGRRGCALPPRPEESDLRWMPDHKHPRGYRGPALVALVTDIETCEPISIHRTWLAEAGRGKAEVEKPRLFVKGHRSDGVVRLWLDAEVNLDLVIGEGIETCLAGAAAGLTPVWACLYAGNLRKFPVLPGLEGLTILVDNDRAGIDASNALIDRYVAAGFDPERDIEVIFPKAQGSDAADLVNAP